MALGRQRERQADMLVSWAEMPRSPRHAFHDKLQTVLIAFDFDGFVETQCAAKYALCRGRPSLPPGRYFRMLLVGYFEGIDSAAPYANALQLLRVAAVISRRRSIASTDRNPCRHIPLAVIRRGKRTPFEG